MKNTRILMLFFFLFLRIQSQSFEINPTNKRDTINYLDASGKKQKKWIIFGLVRPNTCYSQEAKIEEGNYIENKKIGKWIEYFCNGKMKSKIEFQNGRPDGFVIMYNENSGKPSEEGIWRNNRWMGNYKLYYENGNVQHEFTFNASGKREGEQVYHYEDGKTMIKGNWQNGKESGTITELWPDGTIKKSINYLNGEADLASIIEHEPKKDMPVRAKKDDIKNAPKLEVIEVKKTEEIDPGKAIQSVFLTLNGEHSTYEHKQISKTGYFENNQLINGKAYIYDVNGILKRIAVYKKGRYAGDAPLEEQR